MQKLLFAPVSVTVFLQLLQDTRHLIPLTFRLPPCYSVQRYAVVSQSVSKSSPAADVLSDQGLYGGVHVRQLVKGQRDVVQENLGGDPDAGEVNDLVSGDELDVSAVNQTNSASKESNIPLFYLGVSHRLNSLSGKKSNSVSLEVLEQVFYPGLTEN